MVKTAAVGVVALVGMYREEALAQIAVGKVQFQPLETGITRALGGGDKVGANAGDVLERHGLRDFRQVGAERERRRRDRGPAARIIFGDVVVAFPWTVGAGLASGVGELDAGHGTRGLDGCGDGGEGLGLSVVPQPGAARGDTAFGRDRGGFDDEQAGAAARQRRVVHLVPVIDHAVDGHVLAHGRDGDAVAKAEVLEFEGLEKRRHVWIPCSCWCRVVSVSRMAGCGGVRAGRLTGRLQGCDGWWRDRCRDARRVGSCRGLRAGRRCGLPPRRRCHSRRSWS